MLDGVGLGDVARRRVGGFSMGMRQRLALAGALLGDPETLVLDEPSNGLDPEGMRWLRGFLRRLADEGRTVLVSSHVLAELAQSVDDVLIISRGRLVTHGAMRDLLGPPPTDRPRGALPRPDDLRRSVMNPTLTAELRKLRATRTTTAAALVVAGLSAASSPSPTSCWPARSRTRALDADTFQHIVRAPTAIVGFAMLVVGVLASAGEYRHNTIVPSLLAQPRRARLAVAKVLAVGIVGLVMAAASAVVSSAVGWLLLSSRGRPGRRPRPGAERAAGARAAPRRSTGCSASASGCCCATRRWP